MSSVKTNGGFTLLEVVISIAALSLISVFILRMFLASSTLNERAKNADIALTKAISEIENLKKHKSLDEYMIDLSQYTDKPGEYPGVYIVHPLNGDSYELCFYYDEKWNCIGLYTSAPSEAVFCLQMDLIPEGQGLFSVSANVAEVRGEGENRSLAELETKKYFPEKPVAVVQP